MKNIPESPFKGRTIAQNKQAKEFRVTCAKHFFEHQQACYDNHNQVLEQFCENGVISKQQLLANQKELKRKKNNPSFLACVQQSIIDTGGGGKNYKKSNYTKRKGIRTKELWKLTQNNFAPINAMYATLTFDGNKVQAKDLDIALKCFRNFMIRVQKQYEGLRYVAVFSRQQNGNWHFHLLHNAKSMTTSELIKLWKHGFVKQSSLTTSQDLCNVTKYLDKNCKECEEELHGRKGYLCSKNLNRPKIFKSWREQEADLCLDKFEELKTCKRKRLNYDTQKEVGAFVTLDFPDQCSQTTFLSQADLSQTEDEFTIQETVYSHFSMVTVYHDNPNLDCFTIATKKII